MNSIVNFAYYPYLKTTFLFEISRSLFSRMLSEYRYADKNPFFKPFFLKFHRFCASILCWHTFLWSCTKKKTKLLEIPVLSENCSLGYIWPLKWNQRELWFSFLLVRIKYFTQFNLQYQFSKKRVLKWFW